MYLKFHNGPEINFHDNFNEFLAKYNFSCHNVQDLENVVTLFLSRWSFCRFVVCNNVDVHRAAPVAFIIAVVIITVLVGVASENIYRYVTTYPQGYCLIIMQ